MVGDRRVPALGSRQCELRRAIDGPGGSRKDTAEWHTRVPGDGRKVGVTVHHVASVYPLEIQLAQILAEGAPVTAVATELVDEMNGADAREHMST